MLFNTLAVGVVVVVTLTTTTRTTFAFAPRSSQTTSASFATAPAAFKQVFKPVQQLGVSFPRLFATIEEDATATSSKKDQDADSVAKSFDESDAVVKITKKSTLLGEAIPYSQLTIGVMKEIYPGENRVSQTPDSIRTLTKAGMTVVVEKGGACSIVQYNIRVVGSLVVFFSYVFPEYKKQTHFSASLCICNFSWRKGFL